MMTSLDSLFDESLVAAQQPQWPGGKDGAPLAKAVTTVSTSAVGCTITKSLPPVSPTILG